MKSQFSVLQCVFQKFLGRLERGLSGCVLSSCRGHQFESSHPRQQVTHNLLEPQLKAGCCLRSPSLAFTCKGTHTHTYNYFLFKKNMSVKKVLITYFKINFLIFISTNLRTLNSD